MTNRERIIRTLLCEEADRAPFVMWLGFSPWWETTLRWRKESGLADLDVEKYFNFEKIYHVAPIEYGPFPHFKMRTIREDAEYIVSTDWRGITLRNRRDSGSMPEFLDYPVKTRDDWKRYKEEHLQLRLEERLEKLPPFVELSKKTDAPVQIGNYPWGMFGTPRDLMGVEEFLIGFYSEPEMLHDIMDTYATLWLKLYGKVAEKLQIDIIQMWEDMSGKQGSLISMPMVEEFMMPHYDRIAAFARRHNVPVFYVDSDGNVDELVPVMMRHGVNMYLPFEVQAGCDIEEYRARYPKLGIMGGLDKNALALDKPALHRELGRCERMLAKGGYIPGFDHAIPPNATWENFKYFITNLKKMIGV